MQWLDATGRDVKNPLRSNDFGHGWPLMLRDEQRFRLL